MASNIAILLRALSAMNKNWETDIARVAIIPCHQDSSGFSARYYRQDAETGRRVPAFDVGASQLPNRLKSLRQAGYSAPMTRRAMTLVERRTAPVGLSVPLGQLL